MHRDAHVRFENVFYSVDPQAAGRSVVVKAAGESVGDLIEVLLGDQVVAATIDGRTRARCGSPCRNMSAGFGP